MQVNNSGTNYKVVLYIIAISPIFYFLVLFMIQFTETTPNTSAMGSFLVVLKYAFLLFSLIQIGIVNFYFVPKLRTTEPQNIFPFMLYALVLLEAISVYGLLYGLLQLLVVGQNVDWAYVGSLILVSILIMLYYIQTEFLDKIELIPPTTGIQ